MSADISLYWIASSILAGRCNDFMLLDTEFSKID